LATALSFGSYAVPEKDLTARKGMLTVVPARPAEWFVGHRIVIGREVWPVCPGGRRLAGRRKTGPNLAEAA